MSDGPSPDQLAAVRSSLRALLASFGDVLDQGLPSGTHDSFGHTEAIRLHAELRHLSKTVTEAGKASRALKDSYPEPQRRG